MPDTDIGDFSTTASSNSTVGGLNIAEGSTAAQLNDAIRATLAVIAGGDFKTTPVKADTISESTADTGVTIDGLLVKDGALPGLTLGDTIPVGAMVETFKSTADTGWLMMNGDTMGSAASGATRASDSYEDLFAFIWDNVSDTYAAVATGRGASAAADWAANKTIVIPNRADRAAFGAGTTYAAGETFGAATQTLAITNLPSGNIGTVTLERRFGSNGTQSGAGWGADTGNASDASANVASAGSGTAFSIVPPGMGVYYQIRY